MVATRRIRADDGDRRPGAARRSDGRSTAVRPVSGPPPLASALILLQRTAGNDAVTALLSVQRGIRKRGGGTYVKVPTHYKDYRLNKPEKDGLREIIEKDERRPDSEHFTLPQALKEVRARIGASGRTVSGRKGKRLKKPQDLVDHLEKQGLDVSELQDKFDRHASYSPIFSSLELVAGDFDQVSGGSPQAVACGAVRAITKTAPTLIRTASALNELCADIMDVEGGGPGGALKGSLFEGWALPTVLGLQADRQTAWSARSVRTATAPPPSARPWGARLRTWGSRRAGLDEAGAVSAGLQSRPGRSSDRGPGRPSRALGRGPDPGRIMCQPLWTGVKPSRHAA